MCRNWNPHALLVQMQNGTAALVNSTVILHNGQYNITVQSRNFTPEYRLKRTEGRASKTGFTTAFLAK